MNYTKSSLKQMGVRSARLPATALAAALISLRAERGRRGRRHRQTPGIGPRECRCHFISLLLFILSASCVFFLLAVGQGGEEPGGRSDATVRFTFSGYVEKIRSSQVWMSENLHHRPGYLSCQTILKLHEPRGSSTVSPLFTAFWGHNILLR